MLHNALLIFFSFTCSVCFGVTFHIRPKSLPLAGLGGAVTRAALILAQAVLESRFLFTLFAAMVGALYAELVARRVKTPITKFLYPSFVPIIPGDLLYDAMVCVVAGSFVECGEYLIELAEALLGIALGGMLVPMAFHSRRYWEEVVRVKFRKEL